MAGREIAAFATSALARFGDLEPWDLTQRAREIVTALIETVSRDFHVEGWVAVHRSARVETGAVIKGPAIVGPDCLVAAGAYLRGGCRLERGCVIGPGSELKSSFLFAGSTLAHFNFVGDSILGSGVNLEAGAIIANHRNEDREPRPLVLVDRGRRLETGVTKFGAVVGDGVRIGANAVIAPGAILPEGEIVGRLALVDQR